MKKVRRLASIAIVAGLISSLSFGIAPVLAETAAGGGTFVQGNVTGKALDPNKNPLSGKTVQVFDKSGNLVLTTTSGPDGAFSLNSLGTGQYNMVIGNITAPLTVVSAGAPAAAGAATAFEVILGGSGGAAMAGAGVGAGLTVGQWAIVGGAVVLGGAGAATVINNNNNS